MTRLPGIVIVLGLAVLAGCSSAASPPPAASQPAAVSQSPVTSPPASQPPASRPAPAPSQAHRHGGLLQVHDPGQVTGVLTGPCRPRGQLPDHGCTPGSADPAVTQGNLSSSVCRAGYTASVRPPEAQTARFKYGQAYPAYGLARADRTELDHLVPLELGGSNDATNLWPESPGTPNPKDTVENTLHAAVCTGKVTLIRAQLAIARDWVTAEKVLGLAAPAPARTATAAPPPPVRTTPPPVHTTAPPPSSSPPPAHAACYPHSNAGNCYEPGEFCRAADRGMSGVAGDGQAITCTASGSRSRWEAS